MSEMIRALSFITISSWVQTRDMSNNNRNMDSPNKAVFLYKTNVGVGVKINKLINRATLDKSEVVRAPDL
jgi:hypothetical protein